MSPKSWLQRGKEIDGNACFSRPAPTMSTVDRCSFHPRTTPPLRPPSLRTWPPAVNVRFKRSITSPIWRWSRIARHWSNRATCYSWSTSSLTSPIGSGNSPPGTGPIRWRISTSYRTFSNLSVTCRRTRNIAFTSSLFSAVNPFESCRIFFDASRVSWPWTAIISTCIENRPLTGGSFRRNRDVSHWALFNASMMISCTNKQSLGTRSERCSLFELLKAVEGRRCGP